MSNFTPAWIKKGFFNESIFCDDFLSTHQLLYVNDAFFKSRRFSDALIANQRRYNLEHTNNIINSSGRRVRGFVGIEALVQPDLTPNGWRA